jgi:hypothetical protein
MTSCAFILAAQLAATSSTPPPSTATRPDARRLLERVIEMQELRQEQQREYSYTETLTTEYLRKDGTIDHTESKTFQVTPSPEGEYRRLVAEDGRPLSPKKEKEEEEKFRKYIEKQMKLSDAERERATSEKLASRVDRFQDRLREALEVYEFTPLPDEKLEGRRLRLFQFAPREGYRPHSRGTDILNRIEGTVWIDPRQAQITKLHMIFREDLKFFFGLFGRVSKGSEATAEQWQDESGLWLMDNITATLDARLYFLKKYRRRMVYSYSDYEKYSVETEEGDFRELEGDGSR